MGNLSRCSRTSPESTVGRATAAHGGHASVPFRADCYDGTKSYLVKISSVDIPSPKVVLLEGSMRAAALRAVSAPVHAFDRDVGIHMITARCCCRPRHQGQGADMPPGSCGRLGSREMFAGARRGLAQVQADVPAAMAPRDARSNSRASGRVLGTVGDTGL